MVCLALCCSQISKQAVTSFTKSKVVPSVSGKLHHCKKGGSKLKWRQMDFTLRESGIFVTDQVRNDETAKTD